MYTVQHFIGARWHVDLPSIIGRGVRLVAVLPCLSKVSISVCVPFLSSPNHMYDLRLSRVRNGNSVIVS